MSTAFISPLPLSLPTTRLAPPIFSPHTITIPAFIVSRVLTFSVWNIFT